MSQARFLTVRDLFDAYPSASGDIGAAEDSMRTLDFVRLLVGKRDWQAAISVCAYLLPRRVAVAWACRSIRRMVERLRPDDDRMIGFAEAWVEEPEEPRRRKALASGNVATPDLRRLGSPGGRLVGRQTSYQMTWATRWPTRSRPPRQSVLRLSIALCLVPRGGSKTAGNDDVPPGWYRLGERRVCLFA